MSVFQLKKKVDFVIAGTQKGGTTALDKYLRTHNDIAMAKVKEVHFFDNEENFKEPADYSRYHSNFDSSHSVKLRGEATPIYMYWYSAPKRIWDYNPEMKFIIILRSPIERAFSHWNMERDRLADSLSFMDAVTTENIRCRDALPLQHRVFSYINRGFYLEQLRRIWHFFPKKQTLILKSQNLRDTPDAALAKVSSFLEIGGFENIEKLDVHSRTYNSKMTDTEFDYLKKIFFYEIKELESTLGWDCSDWLEK